jgi:hypothetical protein
MTDVQVIYHILFDNFVKSGSHFGGRHKMAAARQAPTSRKTTFKPPERRPPPKARNYPRESNDTPSENAFCCVAPGVRLSDFAIFATGVF